MSGMKSLKTYRLGELIELCDERNTDGKYTLEDVRGISIQKMFIETKADMNGVSLSSYILVKPDYFAYVTVTSRNGEKITIAHNETKNIYIVSSSYIVFRISKTDLLLSDYLFMFFNRPEFDRYSRFNSWGSARETFSWEDFCDTEITLPPLEVQKKYVAVYQSAKANLAAYQSKLDSLKLVCDGMIDKIKAQRICSAHTCFTGKEANGVSREQIRWQKLWDLIEQTDERNTGGKYTLNDVKGISIEKKFIETKADMKDVSLAPYTLVKPDDFAYVTVTSRNGEKITLAHNDSVKTYIVSSSYIVFKVSKPTELLLDYLSLLLSRPEFDRYACFCSWGSARETFDWNEMCEVQISLPSLEIQKDIVNIYKTYIERGRIATALKEQIKELCPVLIRGSFEG